MVKNFGPTRALRDVDVKFYGGEIRGLVGENGSGSYVYRGIIMAAIGMAILNYGLSCMNLGAGGMQQIIMGLFVFGFYTFSAQLGNLTKLFAKLTKKQAAA